jgi:large subunit ribosomal protein L15
MRLDLGTLHPNPKGRKDRKRVGRGPGSGHGKTSSRGMKGQKARYSIRAGFMGGQNPLYKQLPMRRGLSNKSHNIGIFRKEFANINVGELAERFEAGAEITPELLVGRRIVKKLGDGLKVLGEGELDKALTVKAHAFSASAAEKIQKAGGVAEVIVR